MTEEQRVLILYVQIAYLMYNTAIVYEAAGMEEEKKAAALVSLQSVVKGSQLIMGL